MSFSGKETKIDWIQIDGKGDYFCHPKYPDIRVKRNESITEIEDAKNIKMDFNRFQIKSLSNLSLKGIFMKKILLFHFFNGSL